MDSNVVLFTRKVERNILTMYFFTVILFSFPNSSGKVYSLVDATFGLGFTLGPVFGSFLYVAGGFVTPFIVTGCLLLVSCHVTRDSVTLISITVFRSAQCDHLQAADRPRRGPDL